MLSLHDQFHSEENMKHMYDLVNNLLYDSINKRLESIDDYNEYMNNLNVIFSNTESNDLINLNKELLYLQLKYFINKYSPQTNLENNPESNQESNQASKLCKQSVEQSSNATNQPTINHQSIS